ncbi:TIGR01906 family membrane protein [Streptococcus equi]|uniref:Putative membrane protein n=1 Tax=Streptococcus equi subsp. equi (strain 4047) TaxID=553482 RepID=C0M8X5_STRE4|nr:TIGR01906 family membrane protein [Streptococcus equi]ASB97015.1 TIGR01906 family membrane protein [Streptococcus equi subsp. equi]MBT1195596.1 TIGR01906 family membrane protein [Streptococcus equi subsp. equi]MBT1196563.1 TIGR01906 family membrane protein [Streptococcus equi subsp. equi]MBT1199308.1 TIGR01906 family membrane protein [Streptococcus equi subsp. equi]MBT1201145.1 TIGR01906 family membrane protein [Streptococcus equi subsp. equi]
MIEKGKFIASWLWLLALAVLITIYLSWLLYPIEVDYLQLEQAVLMCKKSILHNYNILLTYLTNPFVRELKLASFSASRAGLKHFTDVKMLFHITQLIFSLLMLPTIIYFYQSIKKGRVMLLRRGLIAAALLPIVIACFALMIGFDQFFTLFHQILFVGDSSWLFDPLTDPVIWILPEAFFGHCFALFFFIYEMILWSLIGLSYSNQSSQVAYH